jgi:multidrug efflux pump subunit AcrA (membrane-fusion protein)
VTASAVVAPAQQARLAFLISGTVKELAVSEGSEVAAGQSLLVLNAPDLEYAVLQAQEAARAAEFQYQYWIPARLDRPPERRQLAEQEFIKFQRSLDTAKAALTQATLTSPLNGIVVKINAAPGELVQPGQIVITLADLDGLQIETTDLSERDIPRVKIGQPVAVFVEALDETLQGSVTAISPVADTLGGDVIYKVTIGLDSVPDSLRWGMTAEVNISTQ